MRASKHLLSASILLLAGALALSATPAAAEDIHWRDHDGEHDNGQHRGHENAGHENGIHRGHEVWHGDIHHFAEHDYDHWRGGRWWQGNHGGRHGWWWIINGGWYFYPQPIYPYPDPYTPPTVIIQTAPTAVEVAPANVYYCQNPEGYYPYVARCFMPWQRVAAAEPQIVEQPPVVVQQPQLYEQVDQRQLDDRELNALGVEYQQVNLGSPHAASTLRNLERKIEAFRQELYNRPYSATDIIRDADRLEHNVEAQREGLPRR